MLARSVFAVKQLQHRRLRSPASHVFAHTLHVGEFTNFGIRKILLGRVLQLASASDPEQGVSIGPRVVRGPIGQRSSAAGWDVLSRVESGQLPLSQPPASSSTSGVLVSESGAISQRRHRSRGALAFALQTRPRDLPQMFLIRGIVFSHEAVRAWETKLTRALAGGLRRRRCGKAVRSWYVDETRIKVHGQRRYLYRAIDRSGTPVDVMFSEHRDMAAAKAFFESTRLVSGVTPDRVTMDRHNSHPRAIRLAAVSSCHGFYPTGPAPQGCNRTC
jgi:DDE domain